MTDETLIDVVVEYVVIKPLNYSTKTVEIPSTIKHCTFLSVSWWILCWFLTKVKILVIANDKLPSNKLWAVKNNYYYDL